jgi:hypothetical protein
VEHVWLCGSATGARADRVRVGAHQSQRGSQPGGGNGGDADPSSAGVPDKLRSTLFSTNPIESALSVVEENCGRVKKWQAGDMKLRWVASGLLFAEGQFRRVRGFRDLPQLISAIESSAPPGKNPTLAVGKKAR